MTSDITTDLFRVLITFVVTAVGGVSWWGIRRMVYGQDKINEVLHEISEQISETFVRVGQLETWVKQRERLDDQRHTDNMQTIRDIRAELRKGQP